MNRQNFLGHLALALTLIVLAGFAGQIRRWQNKARVERAASRVAKFEKEYTRERAIVASNSYADEAEVLVRFRSGTTIERIKALVLRNNDRLEDEYENVSGLMAIDDLDGLDAETVAREYAALGEVEYAEPNYEIHLQHSSPGKHKHANDVKFGEQWSLENTGQDGGTAKADISILSAWSKTTGSSKIVVAVLDSGVNYTHPDLIRNIWVRPADMSPYFDDELGEFNDLHGFNATDNQRDPMDDNGHGTHCAGIIGAEGDNNFGIAGINWNVEIMPLKFLNANGSGTTKDAIEAINYAIERKRAGVNLRIISASWGSTQKSKALSDTIKKAGDEGIIFIAAAGNSSEDSDKRPHFPAGYNLPNMVSVAALDRNDNLAGFSNYGAKSVHIAAPGREILSTWLNEEFYVASGTSMATPEVAGVAALILSVNPKMSVKELRDKLFDSVDKLDSLTGKVATGGRINAAKAVGAE
ncbi:MAG: S8 family serine peptidase [Acidobacteria bacterium]|nr:S8 family serine peptidase [Acidobacteriota bacterium]